MKKVSLVLLMLFAGMLMHAQTLPIDSKTGKITFTEVVYVGDSTISKDELYSRAREWFAVTFVSANDVLQMDDIEAGKIIGKGNIRLKKTWHLYGSINFTLTIYLKHGRYKYVITNLNHFCSVDESISCGALENENGYKNALMLPKKSWMKIREQASIEIHFIIMDLKQAMNNNTSQDNDNW